MNHYHPVSNRANFNEVEKEVLDFWGKENIFKKSLENRANAEEYIFFEGPPTANGKPGVHHVLARTFKDLVCRYQTMRGHLVKRQAGWDEHGLPVEIEVQKACDLKTNQDIEDLGIEKFNQLCGKSTQKYIDDWRELTERMAYWVDLDNPYRTSDTEYINKVWGILAHLHNKDLLYQGQKIVPWACDSGTTVSQAEVSLGYQDVIDNSAYVKFKLEGDLGLGMPVYMLAWTTTPWTLPSNMALAVGANVEYGVYSNGTEALVFSTLRREALLNEEENWQQVKTITAEELVKANYQQLFNAEESPLGIHIGDFVENSAEIGTGIVHIAPAFGQDDNNLYHSLNTDLEILNLVNESGFFTEGAPEFLKGESIFNAHRKTGQLEFARINAIILKKLEETNNLHKTEKYEHSYPHNWRTGNPLIYALRPSWYVATAKIKDLLIEANQKINWYPGHIKEGRFGDWLENNIDWAISRERYWGTPLPIWIGDKGSIKVIGSISELEELSGEKVTDPHKHIVDNLTWTECGETFTRVPEVIDCWFDSGSMPIASQETTPDQPKIANYICEAIDQTRGWFYTLLAIAVASSGKAESPYQNVLCLGHILDKDGQKMSKSKGNIVNPWELFEEFGVDALRWYFIDNASAGNPVRFDKDGVGEVVKRFFLQLWNTYAFYVLYANLDNINPAGLESTPDSLNNIDQWMLSRLQETINTVTEEYNKFEFAKVTECIEKFTDDLSNIWVRAGRDRFWNTNNEHKDIAAYYVLNTCLVELTKLIAPCMPLVSDSIYRNLTQSESVHLTNWPESTPLSAEQSALIAEMDATQEVINQGRNLRQEHKVKIRQPLKALILPLSYQGKINNLSELILTELNLKEVKYSDQDEITLDLELDDTLRSEGYARELIHGVQALRKNSGFEVADRIELYLDPPAEEIFSLITRKKDHIMNEVLATNWAETTINGEFENIKAIKIAGEKFNIAVKKV